jgi:hypothetical protein
MTTIKMCDAFIEIPADLWASCYCKLPAGHDGKHSAHYPAERSMRDRIEKQESA